MSTMGMLERSARWIDGVEVPAMDGLLTATSDAAEELAPGVAFVEAFSNIVAFDTADGLMMFDVSHEMVAPGALRGTTGIRLTSSLPAMSTWR